MANANFKITKDSDWKLFNDITKKHEDYFEKIRNKLPKRTNLDRFVYYVLGDYLYEYNGSVVENPEYEIDWWWNDKVSEYADCLKEHMSKAKNIIFQIYSLYLKNKKKIDSYSDDELFDTSADFYGFIKGETVISKPKDKELEALTIAQFFELNLLLAEAGLESFRLPDSTAEKFLKKIGLPIKRDCASDVNTKA